MYDETSAGAVLYSINDKSEPDYLILNYSHGHWDFPKGNIEKGETELETVRREVSEETGINDIKIIDGFKQEISYKYRKKSKLVNKMVIYYVAETNLRDVILSYEHINFEWLDFNKALEKLSFENSKRVLKMANEYILNLKQNSEK